MTWWVHDLYAAGRVTLLIAWIFWVIFSICLHELAHGWAAIRQGDDTPRRLGHMTMNPMVHMGPMSLLVFAFIGIAWGLMPIDPSRFRSGRIGRVYVAAAGPAMNLAIALAVFIIAVIWTRFGTEGRFDPDNDITIILHTGIWLNIVLALFNLLPIPPLDGSQILAGLSWKCYEFFNTQQSQIFGLFVLLVLIFLGAFRFLFEFAMVNSAWAIHALAGLI
jgi:Zn-dependent protease